MKAVQMAGLSVEMKAEMRVVKTAVMMVEKRAGPKEDLRAG